MHAANTVLNDKHDPERRLYCLLYARVGLRLRSSLIAVGEIGQAILAMGHDEGAITTTEAIRLVGSIQRNGCTEAGDEKQIKAGFTMDADLVGTNSLANNVYNLLAIFGEITIFDEFTKKLV